MFPPGGSYYHHKIPSSHLKFYRHEYDAFQNQYQTTKVLKFLLQPYRSNKVGCSFKAVYISSDCIRLNASNFIKFHPFIKPFRNFIFFCFIAVTHNIFSRPDFKYISILTRSKKIFKSPVPPATAQFFSMCKT